MTKSKTNRRSFIGKSAAAAAATTVGAAGVSNGGVSNSGVSNSGVADAQTASANPEGEKPTAGKKVWWKDGKAPAETPLFSGAVSYGNLVFLSGIGAHFEGDITAHTKHVLDEIKKNLEAVGSSMNKVLKANVYLADLKDYDGMNKVFKGSFGPEPPVRTTVSVAGVPGKSLVEIDVIAYI